MFICEAKVTAIGRDWLLTQEITARLAASCSCQTVRCGSEENAIAELCLFPNKDTAVKITALAVALGATKPAILLGTLRSYTRDVQDELALIFKARNTTERECKGDWCCQIMVIVGHGAESEKRALLNAFVPGSHKPCAGIQWKNAFSIMQHFFSPVAMMKPRRGRW